MISSLTFAWLVFFVAPFMLLAKCFPACAKKLRNFKKKNKCSGSSNIKNEKPTHNNTEVLPETKVPKVVHTPQPANQQEKEPDKHSEEKLGESKKSKKSKKNEKNEKNDKNEKNKKLTSGKSPTIYQDVEDDTLQNLPSLIYEGDDTSTS